MRRAKPTPRLAATTAQLAARAAIIILAGVLVYANSLSGPFFFDDRASIVENGAIRSLETVRLERRNSPLAGRPVVGYSLAINYQLDGLDVTGYHIVNIALHIACALLLFAIARRTLSSKQLQERYGPASLDLATGIALLWVVHPLNSEVVNYITQRTESLMALCYLGTLYAAIRSAASRGLVWPAIAVVSCAFGMASKETMVTAPLIVALYDRVFLFDSFGEALAKRWKLYGALATTWLLLAYLIIGGPRSSSAGFSAGIDSWTYLKNQARLIARYLRLTVWPAGLVVQYGPPEPLAIRQIWPHGIGVLALLVLAGIAFLFQPAAGFLGAWFFITLAPASSVIPIATEVGAERRMYLPLMALTALLVISIFRWGRERVPAKAGMMVLVAIAAVLGATTIARNRVYRSPLELAQTSLAQWPSDAAHGAVGSELQMLHRDSEALPELRLGARTDPRAMYNLGVALVNLKQFNEAIQALEPLIARFPLREEVPWARRLRGQAYIMLRQWSPALTELRMTLSMTPRDEEARRLLGYAYFSQGVELVNQQNFRDASQSFRSALEYDPQNTSLRYNLAAAMIDSGDVAGGIAEARAVVERDPTHADSYDLIGRALAIQGKLEEAVESLRQAVRLKPDDPGIRDDLARVQAALKK